MTDIVLETTEEKVRKYRTERDHHYYIQSQEEGWKTLPLYVIENENGCSGEEVIQDDAQDVEVEATMRLGNSALHATLTQLDAESYCLIYALYLADEIKSLRQLSSESGIPVMTLQDRKKKVLLWVLSASVIFNPLWSLVPAHLCRKHMACSVSVWFESGVHLRDKATAGYIVRP